MDATPSFAEWMNCDLGGTPQAHRMRLSRAIDRVAPGLGIDSSGEEDAP